jgi:Mn-dependent DtxR family transcriptional regulator
VLEPTEREKFLLRAVGVERRRLHAERVEDLLTEDVVQIFTRRFLNEETKPSVEGGRGR